MLGLPLNCLAACRKGLIFLLLGMLMLSAVDHVIASKKGRYLTRDEIGGVWIGISGDEIYFLRLALYPNGQGFGADSFRGEEPRVFRIASWRYRPPGLTIETEAVRDEDLYEPGILRGKVVGIAMHLTLSGKGWQTDYVLRREAEFESRWNALKAAMSERLKYENLSPNTDSTGGNYD